MCYNLQFAAKDLPVQWEWKAEEKWIAYDVPTCAQLEEAFQKRSRGVLLSAGYFEDKREYQVMYNHDRHQHVQINLATGGRRAVRRIADDNSHLFKDVEASELSATEQCSICTEPFDSSIAAGKAVKLRNCHGHYFHGPCLSAWVKLKNTCPFCRAAV